MNLINQKQEKYIVIYNMRMAGWLMLQGFVCFDIDDNLKTRDGKKVYFFKSSDQILVSMEYYSANRKDIVVQNKIKS